MDKGGRESITAYLLCALEFRQNNALALQFWCFIVLYSARSQTFSMHACIILYDFFILNSSLLSSGISLVDETNPEDLKSNPAPELGEGISYAYDKPEDISQVRLCHFFFENVHTVISKICCIKGKLLNWYGLVCSNVCQDRINLCPPESCIGHN